MHKKQKKYLYGNILFVLTAACSVFFTATQAGKCQLQPVSTAHRILSYTVNTSVQAEFPMLYFDKFSVYKPQQNAGPGNYTATEITQSTTSAYSLNTPTNQFLTDHNYKNAN